MISCLRYYSQVLISCTAREPKAFKTLAGYNILTSDTEAKVGYEISTSYTKTNADFEISTSDR